MEHTLTDFWNVLVIFAKHVLVTLLGYEQGDQIGRIFAH
jgi:hypothetical protein